MKSLTSLIIASLSILLLLMAQFTSCSSNNGLTTSSSRTTPSTSTSNSNNDDEPDIEDCSDRDSCEEECSKIYEDYGEKTECEDEDVDDVVELGHIYNKLKSGSYSELQDISNNNDDVDTDMLQNYLNIGTSGWIQRINCWKTGANCTNPTINPSNDKLKATLKWILEEDEIAEIIAEADDGDNILEALLRSMPSGDTVFPTYAPATSNINKNTNYSIPTNTNTLEIASADNPFANPSKKTFTFDSDSDTNLYIALSAFHLGISSSGEQNVFSYAAKQENQPAFDLAYTLLKEACNGGEQDKEKACLRAMFCWTDLGGAATDPGSSTAYEDKLNRLVQNHESDLEKSAGSEYDNCRPSDFDDFF